MKMEGALAQTGTSVRVLVVDDNPGFRDSLISLLNSDELQVVGQASSGDEALKLVGTALPDVVLMDVRMPGMDGIETTRRLKERFPAVEVVALTGHEDQRIVREMLVAGASGYVLKDSDGDDILDAIRQAASGHGLLSPEVTPTVIDELTEALERERRRARQLEIAQQALLERAAQRHELVSRLSHEFRTPVTVILATAQLMQRGMMPDEDKTDAIRILSERAEGLARLLDRFEAAVESGFTEWADVNGVARDVAAAHDRVDVEPSRGPAMATLNRAAARRILEELVENALAFSSEDAPVLVKVRLQDGVPEVRVVDRGAGIDPAATSRIFEALEQEEDLHTRTHQGVGFGLTLARMSARTMDGDVVLESSGPEGSTFLWTVSGVPAEETTGEG
jgi:DNA-binding NarL/FixJ family response regulator